MYLCCQVNEFSPTYLAGIYFCIYATFKISDIFWFVEKLRKKRRDKRYEERNKQVFKGVIDNDLI